jgi:hypothetical protein
MFPDTYSRAAFHPDEYYFAKVLDARGFAMVLFFVQQRKSSGVAGKRFQACKGVSVIWQAS